MLQIPNSPRSRRAKQTEIPRLQPDPRARMSTHVEPLSSTIPLTNVSLLIPDSNVSPCKDSKKENKSFMTLGTKKRLQKALVKMNILPKNIIK